MNDYNEKYYNNEFYEPSAHNDENLEKIKQLLSKHLLKQVFRYLPIL